MRKQKAILGWHFVGSTLRNGDPVPADGVTLKHDGPLVMCVSGLHFSKHPCDALQYAPGPILCWVKLGGEVIYADDKGIASERTIIKRVDMTKQLRKFACDEALRCIKLWDAPEIVVRYLKTQDKFIRAAARAAA